jgi:hypothetical protein
MLSRELCRERLRQACHWLVEVAQVKQEAEVGPRMRARHPQLCWTGAIRGEYRVATGEWEFFCPVWHTGQAIKALVAASDVLGDAGMESAVLAGEFILNNRVTEGPDRGLILAYEDHGDKVNTSAILECLDGLFALSAKTGIRRFSDAALDALDWVQRKAILGDTGLALDLYDPGSREFLARAYGTEGRPLLDDAVFVTAHRLTGREDHWTTAQAVAGRLLADEAPAGNWVNYAPCHRKTGAIHPRHAYWWGRPMLAMFEQSRDERHRELFLRSCDWYRRAMRRDGGIMRNTYPDFTTDSFGHATSGVGCAVIMFLEASKKLGRTDLDPLIERGLSYGMNMQFTQPEDPNLMGCVLEKIVAPDGTDASPYHIRDLGTIFFVQAMAMYLKESQ